jgi:hypothetical protein
MQDSAIWESIIIILIIINDRLCGLVVRIPGCRTEYVLFPVRYELNL